MGHYAVLSRSCLVYMLSSDRVVLMGLKPALDNQLAFQYFYTVGWVIWHFNVPKMTYKVSSGTLSLHSLTHRILPLKFEVQIDVLLVKCDLEYFKRRFS